LPCSDSEEPGAELAISSDAAERSVERQASAPSTSIETRVVLADASSQTMVLQKRVVDKSGPNQRAVLALELWDPNSDRSGLVARLDVLRIIEIRQMTPATLPAQRLTDISFILTAHADAVLNLRPGRSSKELFHTLDATEGGRLTLHVSVAPCASLQSEARRFFNGLRLLARLPSNDWERLASDESSLDASVSGDMIDDRSAWSSRECTGTQRSKNKPKQHSGTLKVDLSQMLREEFGPSSAASRQEKRPTPRQELPIEKQEILFNACHVRAAVVLEAARARGWTIVTSPDKAASCNVHWVDDGSSKDWLPGVMPWMRVNHFPGTCRVLGRKCRLARTMSRMQMLFPDEYSFVPRTWILPEDFPELAARVAKHHEEKKGTYIVKPDGLSQGRGIFLTDDLERIRKCSEECHEKNEGFVVQKYIANPMLLNGLKFDMRIYLLVVGGSRGVGDDMRLFLFRDGLVRLCSTEYETPTPETFDQVHMHITNYELNRKSTAFKNATCTGEESGSGNKRSMAWLLGHIASQYGQEERQRVWSDVVSICVKTVLASQPTLDAEYDACFTKDRTSGGMGCRSFEILGFDIMLDARRKAYLLEVNHLPSLSCHSPLDHDIKRRLIDQTLDLTCGSIDAHVTNKSTYERLVSANNMMAAPSGSALLDLPSYKDFDRVFPAGDGSSDELATMAMTISEKVRFVFGSVMSARPRGISPPPLGSYAAERRASSPPPLQSQVPLRRGRANSRPRSATSEVSLVSTIGSKMGARQRSTERSSGRNSRLVRSSSVPGLANNMVSDKDSSRSITPRLSNTSVSLAAGGTTTRKDGRRGSAWSLAGTRGLTKSDSTGRINGKASVSSSSLRQSVARASIKQFAK